MICCDVRSLICAEEPLAVIVRVSVMVVFVQLIVRVLLVFGFNVVALRLLKIPSGPTI